MSIFCLYIYLYSHKKINKIKNRQNKSIYKSILSIKFKLGEMLMSKENLEKLLKNVEKSLKNANSNSEWDNFVPIVTDGFRYTAYLTETIGDPSPYNRLYHKLLSADEHNEFTLVISSPGGTLDSAFMIADAIKCSPAKVTCKLIGTVASAATIIALVCDEMETTFNLAFMIHNYSSVGISGKGHEIKAQQRFTDRELNKSFKKYYAGFLSDEEIEDVIDGKDIWMNAEEVDERWKKKKSGS